MSLHPTLTVLVVVLTVLLETCSGPTAIANETWTLVGLVTKGERTETHMVTVDVRNCGVPEDKTHSCSAGTSNDLSISLSVLKWAIGPEVAAELGIGRDSGQSLHFDPPPEGVIDRYKVREEYTVKAGDLRARSNGGNEQVTSYTFHATCSLRIESQQRLTCSGGELATSQPLPTVAPVRPTAQPATPTQPRSPICYEKCWQYDVAAQTMTWTGAADGMVDIHQDGDEMALGRIRAGWTAIIKTSVPGEIGACILIINGQRVLNKCTSPDNSDLYPVPADQVLRIQSPGPNGGFRWLPAPGYGYR